MATPIIKDLSLTADLDRKTMASVHGGTSKGYAPSYNPLVSVSKSDFGFDATQLLGQSQETVVNNGNNVAFASGITANVNPHQTGTNTINFN